MEIIVFGGGYVGLVQAAGLASTGNEVTIAEVDDDKITQINSGQAPFYEPQLPELLSKGVEQSQLRAVKVGSDEFDKRLKSAEIIFIAVQTPESSDGSADLKYVFEVVDTISKLPGDLSDRVVVMKSTVPVGTGDAVENRFNTHGKNPIVASNPEFLKQGSAVRDFMQPERVIIGSENERAQELLSYIYKPFMLKRERIICMGRRSAELVKYACNAFLATKISFINEISQLAEMIGADIRDIRRGMITDSRIGDQFLFPGVGFGGSCFPKDTISLVHQGEKFSVPMRIPQAVDQVNKRQRTWALLNLKDIFKELKDKSIAIWGLSFKPKTDDLREAPSVYLIEELIKAGAKVRAHDPIAIDRAKTLLAKHSSKIQYFEDMYAAAESADALVLMTEWHEYRSPSFKKLSEILKNKIILDGRNVFGPEITRQYGFRYRGVGIPENLK
ncbi:MAG: UDP-glucose 6-dehydrogenase [Deltaproteobacteria bacterium CG11_big_fil_rev_8_21_14_0_20_45_16]|nr:MAG: UDP-glucose 6-dehydrogenase [Deltaproteobacteria bacterium CG11_big_fil_rev_8_21_14_0_20_45_16]